jgi:hypothetical protein
MVYTITSPRGEQEDRLFGWDVGIVGDNIVASSKAAAYPDQTNPSDIVYVFDGNTGSLLYTIDDPVPDVYDAFGPVFTDVGNNLAVSHDNTNSFDPIKNTIYVFEGTGDVLGSSISYVMIAVAAAVAALAGLAGFRKSRFSRKSNPELMP